MFYGILDHIEEDRLGSSLTVAATVGAASITVDWTVDFGDEGTLTLAGVSYDYDTVDSDLSTIGLVAGETITVAAAVGEEVGVVTSVDEESVVWKAYVLLPDADQAQPVVVPLETRRFYVLGDGQRGTMVPIDVIGDGDMVIAGAPGEAADASHDYDFPDPAEVAVDPPDEVIVVEAAGDALGITAFTKTPIHPSTVLDWFLDGVPIEEGTRTTVIRIDAIEHSLVAGTDYTITAQPRNVVDTGALSNAVIVQLNPAIDSQTVLAWVAAGFILAGIIQVGAAMTFDSTGITITHPDGRQTFMRADGSGNQFVGQAILDAVTILGVLAIQGGATLSSVFTLLSGVTDPSSKPGVTAAGWDSVSYGNPAFTQSGMFNAGTDWLFTFMPFGPAEIRSHNKTTGFGSVLFNTPANFQPIGGVVKVGTNFYVLGKDLNRSANWYCYIYNSSFTKTGEWRLNDAGPTPVPADHSCAIGIDGAGALLIARRSTSDAFTINVYSLAGVASAAAGAYQTWAGATITGVQKVAVDTATVRYVVSSYSSGTRVFNVTTAARVSGEEWTLTGASVRGLGHDGTNFYSQDGEKFYKYTNLIGTWDFAFDWADTDTGGASGAGTGLGGANTARTRPSQIRTIAPTKRAKWTISLPSAPQDDGTTDGSNTADLYAAPTGNTLVLQTTLADGVYSATYSTLATSGTAPSATNGFAARLGAIGRLISYALTGAGDPMIEFKGNGDYRLAGTNLDDVALTNLTPAAGFAFTGGTLGYQVKNGQVYVFANFTATTGTPFTAQAEVTIVAAGGIPTALRPAVPAGSGARLTGGGFSSGEMSVLSDGSVVVMNSSAAGSNRSSCRSTVSYPKP